MVAPSVTNPATLELIWRLVLLMIQQGLKKDTALPPSFNILIHQSKFLNYHLESIFNLRGLPLVLMGIFSSTLSEVKTGFSKSLGLACNNTVYGQHESITQVPGELSSKSRRDMEASRSCMGFTSQRSTDSPLLMFTSSVIQVEDSEWTWSILLLCVENSNDDGIRYQIFKMERCIKVEGELLIFSDKTPLSGHKTKPCLVPFSFQQALQVEKFKGRSIR